MGQEGRRRGGRRRGDRHHRDRQGQRRGARVSGRRPAQDPGARRATSVPIGTPIAVIGKADEPIDLAALGVTKAAAKAAGQGRGQGSRPCRLAARRRPPRPRLRSKAAGWRLRRSRGAWPTSWALTCDQVPGSGPGGRIIKRDIEAYLAAQDQAAKAAKAAPAPRRAADGHPVLRADDGRLPRRAAHRHAPDHRAPHGGEQAAGAALLHHDGRGHGRGDGAARAAERAAAGRARRSRSTT